MTWVHDHESADGCQHELCRRLGRGPGRPSTGTPIHVRIPADQLAALDAAATAEGTTRADIIRQLITNGLTGKGWLA